MKAPLKEIELVSSLGHARVVLYGVPGERDSESGIFLSGRQQYVVKVQRNGGTDEPTTRAFGF